MIPSLILIVVLVSSVTAWSQKIPCEEFEVHYPKDLEGDTLRLLRYLYVGGINRAGVKQIQAKEDISFRSEYGSDSKRDSTIFC